MKLTSLGEKYSELSDRPLDGKNDEYFPSLYLSEKQIEDLGIDNVLVGTEMQMVAVVRLSSLSESKGGPRSMSFEITKAAISPKEDKADASSVLFPNG